MKKINKVRFLFLAINDLKEITKYHKKNNSSYANKLINKINNVKKLLLIFPLIGKKKIVDNINCYFFRVDKYILIYIIEKEEILITRILHDKRDITDIEFLNNSDYRIKN